MPWNLPHRCRHIQFRPLASDDLTEFLAYRSDRQVARFQGWSAMSEAEASAFLAAHSAFTGLNPGQWSQLGIAAIEDNRLIGDAGLWLSENSATAEFGISLARGVQGQGLGSEAATGLLALIFASTTVTEIVAWTDHRNLPCRKALARAGMLPHGTRTETWKGELCTEDGFRIVRR